MDTSKLRPDTARVWNKLAGHPALHGFVLIGGTALALRIGHRLSEDLDMVYPSLRLPQGQIGALLQSAPASGLDFKLNQDPIAEDDFIDAGLELRDFQQNYIVDGSVKLSFFAPDHELGELMRSAWQVDAPLRVATMEEIFISKCLVCADRSKTRDWFDLYVLLTCHGYTMYDFYMAFKRFDALAKFDNASGRLRRSKPPLADEGYETLLPDPPTLDQMRQYFEAQLDLLESELAKIELAKGMPPTSNRP